MPSASLQQGGKSNNDGIVRRVSAVRIERVLEDACRRWLRRPAAAIDVVGVVQVHLDRLTVTIAKPRGLHLELAQDERLIGSDLRTAQVEVPISLGSDRCASASPGAPPEDGPDATLIAALRRAHRMLSRERSGPMLETAPVSIYERKILRLALLAPDLQSDIFAGRQPPGFNLEAFMSGDVPIAWAAQRRALGWG